MDSEGAQELGPDGANELSATVGEEPAGCAEIGNDMAHEGFTDCIGSMVAGRDEDSILGEAIHEDNQELVAVVWRKRSHNVNPERVPGAMGLDGTSRLLAVAIVGATLGTTLRDLQADAAAGLVGVPVAEELQQCVATKVGSSMKLTGDLPGFIFVVQQPYLQDRVVWRWGIDE